MREVLHTDVAPTSPLYSQGVRVGSQIRVSGLVGIDAATGRLAGSTIQEETRQALTNCRAVLRAGAGALDDVVEVGVLLADPDDFADMNEDYAGCPHRPALPLRGQARGRHPGRSRVDPHDRRQR